MRVWSQTGHANKSLKHVGVVDDGKGCVEVEFKPTKVPGKGVPVGLFRELPVPTHLKEIDSSRDGHKKFQCLQGLGLVLRK